MADILVDLSQNAMAAAVLANLHAFFARFGASPRNAFLDDTLMMRWQTPVRHPWFNGVVLRQAPGAQARGKIGEVVDYFQARRVDHFTCWLAPGISSSAWAPYLSEQGFHLDTSTPGMAADLAKVRINEVDSGPFRIQAVETNELLRVWVDTFTAGYEIPHEMAEDFYWLLHDMGIGLPFRHYIGFVGDDPVATSSLFYGAGVAGIYNVSTIPARRRQGLGRLLTLHPLRDAAAMGYRAAVLQSSRMGAGVYREIGFEQVCWMEHFAWDKT